MYCTPEGQLPYGSFSLSVRYLSLRHFLAFHTVFQCHLSFVWTGPLVVHISQVFYLVLEVSCIRPTRHLLSFLRQLVGRGGHYTSQTPIPEKSVLYPRNPASRRVFPPLHRFYTVPAFCLSPFSSLRQFADHLCWNMGAQRWTHQRFKIVVDSLQIFDFCDKTVQYLMPPKSRNKSVQFRADSSAMKLYAFRVKLHRFLEPFLRLFCLHYHELSCKRKKTYLHYLQYQ